MCKKHHDKNQTNRVAPPSGDSPSQCRVIENNGVGGRAQFQDQKPTKSTGSLQKPSHKRGLSIFQEMSADTVGNLLLSGNPEEEPSSSGSSHGRGFSRDFIY